SGRGERSLQAGLGGERHARGVAVIHGLPFSGLFMASALGGSCIDIGGTSPPLRQCVGSALRPSCSGGRKAGVGSGEVSLKLSSGASLPTLLPSSATPWAAWVHGDDHGCGGVGRPAPSATRAERGAPCLGFANPVLVGFVGTDALPDSGVIR